jgi:hypothetical protein
MTISTSRGLGFNVDTIILRAYQLAGLRSAMQSTTGDNWNELASVGRSFLEIIMDELQTDGAMVRNVIFRDVPLVVGTFRYTMASDVLDVIGDGMYIPATETDLTKASGETPVIQISRAQWHGMSSKNATSRPTMYYVYRSSDIEVWLYPVPIDAGTIRFQIHRLSADVNVGSNTVDFAAHWTLFFVWELAHMLAVSSSVIPDTKCKSLRDMARYFRAKSISYSRQHTSFQISPDHSTPWS